MLSDWDRFWKSFGYAVGDILVPLQRLGFDRLLVVPKGLTTERMFQICKGPFPCRKYVRDDLDGFITINSRTAENGSYAIWIRERVEADEEFKHKSWARPEARSRHLTDWWRLQTIMEAKTM